LGPAQTRPTGESSTAKTVPDTNTREIAAATMVSITFE